MFTESWSIHAMQPFSTTTNTTLTDWPLSNWEFGTLGVYDSHRLYITCCVRISSRNAVEFAEIKESDALKFVFSSSQVSVTRPLMTSLTRSWRVSGTSDFWETDNCTWMMKRRTHERRNGRKIGRESVLIQMVQIYHLMWYTEPKGSFLVQKL